MFMIDASLRGQPWEPRWQFAGGYPCCCAGQGSSLPPGSSVQPSDGSGPPGGPPCPCCTPGTVPLEFQIDIDGLAARDNCPGCPELDGTYFVQGTLACQFDAPGDQLAYCATTGQPCGSGGQFTSVALHIQREPDPQGRSTCRDGTGRVRLRVTLEASLAAWSITLDATQVDCRFAGLELLPEASRCSNCDLAASTCRVTAVAAP